MKQQFVPTQMQVFEHVQHMPPDDLAALADPDHPSGKEVRKVGEIIAEFADAIFTPGFLLTLVVGFLIMFTCFDPLATKLANMFFR